MAREKAPAFQFYVKDWLSDERVRLMSHTEKGVYMDLLCFCWNEGSLPLETDSLARLLSLPLPRFTKLWENSPLRQCFFVGEDGRLHHKRLDEERLKQTEFRRRQTDSGKKGAETRWGRHSEPIATPHAVAIAKNSSSSSSSSASASAEQERRPPPLSADELHPRQLVFSGQRLKLFGWHYNELKRLLGEHLDAFRLDEWFTALDAELLAKGEIPPRDNGAWLTARALAEAQQRGIPLKVAAMPTATKSESHRDSVLRQLRS